MMGVNFILSGIVGSFIYGVLIDKVKNTRLLIQIIAILSFITISATLFTLPTKNAYIFNANLTLGGLALIPVIPVGYQYSVELTEKDGISESMANGMMVLCS